MNAHVQAPGGDDLVARMRATLQRGKDTRQLAVPIDLEDLAALIAAADEVPWFGCFTGDCPHQTQSECDSAIRKEFARLERLADHASADDEMRVALLMPADPSSEVTT